MNTHKGNDLNIFNEVTWCVKAHAIHYNMDYTALKILSGKQLVQLLTKYYQLNFLKPTLHSVALTDGSVATVGNTLATRHNHKIILVDDTYCLFS